ncbi:MAG: hypothetical protein EYC70_05065 [Planctomycetota bacterium]|nr:MAG: hypothetical protein EYC70_05065 [Planctomycetota bacterium]
MAAPVPAQLVRGGDLVVADFYANGAFRVTRAGVVTPLYAGAPLLGPADVAVDGDLDVFIADFTGGAIYRIESTSLLVPVAGGISGPIRMAVDHNGDLIVTTLTSGQLLRVTQAGVATPIASGFFRPFGVTVEPGGDYLVTTDLNPSFQIDGRLWRVDRATGNKMEIAGNLDLAEAVALFHDGDYAVASGNPDYVDRIDRVTGFRTRLVSSPPLGNPCDLVGDFAGGFYVSESGLPAGNRIVHVDAAGALTVVSASPLLLNPEGLARAPQLSGPTAPFTGPGADFDLLLDFPGEGGRPYKIVAALSVFPGIALPAPDPRGSPLNPDVLFLRTRMGDFSPFTSGWTGGALGPQGRARAALNLSSLAPGALAGMAVHLHAFTLDAAAPSGLRSFSNVLSLHF